MYFFIVISQVNHNCPFWVVCGYGGFTSICIVIIILTATNRAETNQCNCKHHPIFLDSHNLYCFM